MRPGAIAGPAVLILIGIVFLLNNMGLEIPIRALLRNGWPLIVVAIGVVQMLGALAGRRGSFTGGAILVAVGSLFTLQQAFGVGFRHTWPVLLIVIGAIGLVRALAGPEFPMDRGARFTRGGLPR